MALLSRTVFILALLLPLSSFGADVTTLKLIQPVLTDDKEGTIKQPEGVACNDTSLIIADTGNGRLLSYTFKDGVVKGGTETKIPQLTYPARLQLNSKGELFALDGRQRRIARLSPQGAFLGFLDPQGLPTATVPMLRSFKIDTHDNIYLLDIFSENVIVLDPTGKYQKQINFPASKGFFSDLAVNPNGDILLIDSVNSIVYVAPKDAAAFTPLTKSLKADMDFPVYMTTDSRGVIYVVDQNGGGIVILGQDGSFRGRMLSMGWKVGFLSYPSQICMTSKGDVFVADRANNRVQIFEMVK